MTIVTIFVAPCQAQSPVNQNIILTNGPASPNGRVYLGATRTNILLCQIELDSTYQVLPWYAWAQFQSEVNASCPGGDRSISNVRCYTSNGELIDYPTLMGGWIRNDGTAYSGFYNFYRTYNTQAFSITPGTPTLINIYGDLGSGFKTGDTIKIICTGTQIHNLLYGGNFYSPNGQAVGSIIVNSDEARIDSIEKPSPTTVKVSGHGKPSATYRVETATSPTGPWSLIDGGNVVSSTDGSIQFDGHVNPETKAQFFRFVLP